MSVPVASEGECLDIVGRRAEREELRNAVQATTSGSGGLVVVAGDPGLGKSTLLAAAEAEARAARLPILRLAPRLGDGTGSGVTSYGSDIHHVVERAGGAERAVVMADDLHTIRPDHLPRLVKLLHLSMAKPVLLVGSYRPRQTPRALAAVLAQASDAGALRTLSLATLSLIEAGQLLGDRPDLERLYRLGDGNPQYLQALADPWGPASIALLGELSGLSGIDLQVAQTAAALGDHFTAALLTAVAAVDAGQTTAALDRLVTADIIRSLDLSPRFAFRHPVLTRIVYEQIGIGRRRALHLRAESVLAESNATTAQRARHVARAADPAVPDHLETLLQGARETLELDPTSAAEWLATACLLMAVSDPRQAEARLLLARAQLLRGAPGESRRVLHELLTHTGGPHLLASAAVSYGRADRLLGRPSEARALFEHGLAGDADSGDSVTIHTEIADIALEASDFVSAVRHSTTAADLARRLLDRTGEAGALSVAALAQLYAGRTDVAQQTAVRAAHLVDGLPDAALISNLACLNSLGMTESALGLLSNAERHLSRGLALSDRTGQTYIRPDLLKTLSDVRLRRGDLTQAAGTIAEARAATAHDTALSALVETIHAEALLWQADDVSAVAAAERALELCDGATAAWAIITRLSSADILIRAGHPDRGSRLLTSAAGGLLLPRLPAARRARWWESLMVAATVSGDAETVAYLTEHAVGVDQDVRPSGVRRGYVLRARMHSAGLRADIGLAAELAASAGECFASAQMRLETGRTLLAAARICVDAGEVAGVDERLDDARYLALRCGSRRLLDDVEQLRRRCSQLVADDADHLLTDREREVAGLARTGMRSKDIADQLFVSVRTVDTHLSRVYRKLGISTRTELAARLADRVRPA